MKKVLIILAILMITMTGCVSTVDDKDVDIVESFIVEFVDYDGTMLQSNEFEEETDFSGVTPPIDPSRVGYTFTGWDTTIPTTFGTSKVTITAMYDINQTTIEFVDYDGTVLQTKNYDYGVSISEDIEPTEPTREGYTFTGWDKPLPSSVGTEKVTLTATYTVNQYTVEYVDHDGTILYTGQFDFGSDLSEITPPTELYKEDHTFSGWDKPLPTSMGAEDLTITALHDINQFAVEYVDHDGTVLQTKEYDVGSDLSNVAAPINPIRAGYTFSGWDNTVPEIMGQQKITITATYIIEKFIVDYVDYDGTSIQSISYDAGTELSTMNHPSDIMREGFSFTGWVPETSDALLFSDMTFTASYIEVITITGTGPGYNLYYSPNIDIKLVEDYVVISSGWYNNNQGRIQVYKQSDTSYKREIIGSTTVEGDYFASSMQISGDYIIVNAHKYNEGQGALFIYKLSDESYERIIEGPELNDKFPGTFKVSGDYIVAGSSGFDNSKQAAYIYKLSDESYIREIERTDTSRYFYFASHIRIQDDYIIFENYQADGRKGTIYLYKLSDDSYYREITSSELTTGAEFGYDIQFKDDYIIVYSKFFDSGKGAVLLFKFSDESYERIIEFSQKSSNLSYLDIVTINGDNIIIRDMSYNEEQGKIYLFKFSDETYEREIIGTDTEVGDYFGYSISYSDDYLAVSSRHHNNNQGKVFVYKFIDEDYERIVTGSLTVTGSTFGESVLIEDDFLIVSASDLYIWSKGQVYLYKLSDDTYERYLRDPDSQGGTYFGETIKYINDYLIVSHRGYNHNQGAVQVYKPTDENYCLTLIGSDITKNRSFGSVTQITGGSLIIDNGAYDNYNGAIYIYQIEDFE